MPGFTTHYLFGQQTYHKLPSSDLKHIIQKHPQVFSLGLQGPDIFFYSFLPHISKKENPGSLMHTTNTGTFLYHLFKGTLMFSTTEKQKIAQSYALGFMGHYLLDSTCHPYIYARSTSYQKKDSMGRHILLETDIDNSLLWFFKRKLPSEFHQTAVISLTKEQMHIVSALLVIAFRQTYPKLTITKNQILQAIKAIQKGTRMLYDATGIKKAFIHRLESVFPGHPILSSLIAKDNFLYFKDPCNICHKHWKNPWNEDNIYTESFFDLFEKAQTEYLTLLFVAENYFSKELSLRQKEDILQHLLKQLGSRHYHSGLLSTSDLL